MRCCASVWRKVRLSSGLFEMGRLNPDNQSSGMQMSNCKVGTCDTTQRPVIRCSASSYRNLVFSTISAGNGGGGGFLSQTRLDR